MLKKKAIIEYQELVKKVYKLDISFDEATVQANKLLNLFRAVYKPLPINWQELLNKKYAAIPS
ncbi:hypothetical protein A2865_02615 [Candidatus Woesebacteria bacterium RIFCSPHIGHO2_01_FULL_39_17]|uniref:Uncharacterized protein n=3 Tax=Candidatus Woeseibacteriota TaxID=1752722 RepID=A0A0G0RJV4_9BACT|nr:MAG: hypothetical protein US72_C0003G0100 [Microgenomates group bacterium GW2011_GWC1_38_12]KKQ94525.1 MAG: hypothetical protein UT19_C0001G0057 [Candidatus Woesebacteria bacterium GW2011_GWB1_39_10b]KKR13922.1 MAG: hypothetical protein UT40_C0008G0046 [Candidatus Woesebacteria bacterium GW2011_GWA1_39_21b]OGM22483.1 MAG: hypothetical protein A2865_02615 [Candidatus Woesebacteria bacterium RIFCSPHIGHO2_01_FULL_39_17]OGM65534.1 MAG: hypothetical protein A3A52_01490 [Candidatus Woesebacteria b